MATTNTTPKTAPTKAITKVVLEPGMKIALEQNGVPLNAEQLNGENLVVTKAGDSLMVTMPDGSQTELVDFFITDDVTLEGDFWDLPADSGLVQTAGGVVAKPVALAQVADKGVLGEEAIATDAKATDIAEGVAEVVTETAPAVGAGGAGGVLAGVAGLGLAAGGGGGDVGGGGGGGGGGAVVDGNTYTLTAVAGPQSDNGAGTTVALYKASGVDAGQLLGTMSYDSVKGKYSFLDTTNFTGVIIAKLVDTDSTADYISEATGEATNFGEGTVLMSVAAINGTNGAVNLTISPLTTAAAKNLGVSATAESAVTFVNPLTGQTVVDTNKALAMAFNILDADGNPVDISTQTVNTTVNLDGAVNNSAVTGTDAASAYGRALALVANAEKASGLSLVDMAQNIALALKVDGSGAAVTGSLTKPSSQTDLVQQAISQGASLTQASGQMLDTQVTDLMKSTMSISMTMAVLSTPTNAADTYLNAQEPTVDLVINGTFTAGQTLKLFNGSTAMAFKVGATAVVGSTGYAIAETATSLTITVARADLTANATNLLTAQFSIGTGEATISNDLPLVVDTLINATNAKLTLDSTNAQLTAFAADGVTNNPAITAPNNAEAGAVVEYRVTKGTDASGDWSTVYTAPVADGTADDTYKVEVRQIDKAGNISTPQAIAFTLDSSKPATPNATFTDSTNGLTTDSVGHNADGITNNAAVTAPANVEAGARVEYRVTKGTGTPSPWSSTYTAPPANGTADGAYKVEVRQTDKAGNVSAVQTLNFTLDSTVPVVANAALTTDSGISTDTITNSGAITAPTTTTNGGPIEVGANVEYRVTKGAGAPSDWSAVYNAPAADGTADGVYKVEVRQTDKAGNASVQTVNFTLDTQATSAISFVGLTDQDVDSNYTVAPNQVISGNGAEAGATVQLFTTVGTGSPTAVAQTVAAADGSFNFILPTPASAGVQTFSLTYTDKAGNTSDSGATTAVNWGTTPIDTAPSQLNGLALSAATDSGVSQSDGITNIAGATLTGSGALNGATIEITATPKGGEAVILTTASPIEANSSGVWSYTLNSTDANSLTADTTFTVRQKAAGGTIWSPASPSYQVVFDNAAPAGVPTVVLSSNSDTFGANVGTNTDGITSSRTLILGGTAEANAYIDLLDNGVKIATLQADSTGAWTTTLSNVSAAEHNYTARQFDAAGNATAYSSATVVTVDVTAAAPTAAVLDAGSDTGALGDRITTVTTPKLSGTGAEPGALISVFDGANQTPLATTTVQANGSWSVTTSALTVGAHNLRIGQTDLAGNISALSAPLSLNIAAPITVATPSAPLLTAATDTGLSQTDQTTNATALVFTGTGAVAGGTVELWQGSVKLASVSTSAAGTWTVALTSSAIVLPESTTPHNIKARVIDGQGNISGFSAETPVTIDRTAPTSSLTLNDLSATDDSGRSNSDGIIQQTQPTISGSGASADAKVQIFNGTNTTPLATLTANDSGAFSGFVSLPAGSSHSLYAAQIDAAGNLGPKSNLLVVNVDNTAATAPVITTLLNDLAGNPMISGTAEANAFIELLVGTSVVGTGYADASGEWIVQWVQATADDYSLAARQTDVAGNVSNPSQAASATISGTNPAAAVVSAQLLAPTLKSGEDTHIVGDGITSKTAPTIVISGVDTNITTTDVSTRLKVYDNGGLTALAGTFNSLASGRWEFTPTDKLAASASGVSHSLSVTQTVGASPESLLSAGLNMTVDNEAAAPTFVPDKSTFGFARYVMVYRAGYLQLGDVHVYVDGVNVALGRAGEGFAITGAQGAKNNVYANQSIASLTDGDTGIAPYSHAVNRPISWVQIDLGQVYNIDNIVVYPAYKNLRLSRNLTVLTSKTSMGSSGQDVVLADLRADPDVVWSAFPSVNTAYVGMESVNVPITKGYVTPLAEKNALSGTGEPGATVTLYDTVNSVKKELGTALVASDGKWTVPFSGFTTGDHSLTFTQTDRAGNISPESSAQNITGLPPYPTSIPSAPTLTLLAADDTTSAGSISFAADNITSKTSVTIHGTGSHGETVQVFADLGGGNYNPLGTTNVALDGKWSLAGISLAVNGSTTLVAKSSNALGSSDFGDALTVTNNSTVPPAPTVGLAAAADTGVQGDKLTNTGLTDDFITLSGTAEAGALITIHSDTVQVNANNVYADDSGNWSSALTAGLTANAGNTFTVTVTNKVGVVNTTPVSYTVTHDDIAPVGTLAVTSSLKATLLPTVAGTGAEANAYVDIYAGTTLLGSTQASGTGSWSLQLTRLDAAGSYDLSARHRDAAGNVQDGSTAFTLTVADDAPIVNNQSLILENVGLLSTDDTGTVGDNVTSLTTPRLTGNGAQAMANVQLWNGTELIGSTNADSTGAWVITPNVPLSAGLHKLSVVQQGTGQNISPALPYTLYVASSLPAPTLDSSLFGGDGSITLEEATAGTATLNGTSVNGAAVNVTYTNTTGVSVVKAATVTNGADVATGATWVAPSLTPVELLTLGEGTITISATQTYGSVSSSPVTAQVTVAALPAPTTAITVDAGFTGDTLVNGVGDGVVSGNETPTFKGAATTDASVSVVVTNTITGASVTLDPVTAVDSEWSAALTADQRTALGGDGHALSITATQTLPSSAGISSATATVTIDTVAGSAPSAPVLAAFDANNTTVSDSTTQGDNTTNATTPTFTGTAALGATVKLYNNGSTTPIGTGVADGNTGIYTIKVTTPLNGSATGTLNNITAKQTDAAGNESAASTALSVTVDSTAVAPVLVAGVAPVAAAPTLKGTGEAGATVEIFDSAAVVAETNASGKIGSTVVNADGTWSFQATGIVSGSHTITTQQTDLAGNKSAPSNAYTFMVDSGVMGTPVLDAASDSGTVGDGITRVSTPTLKGTTLTSDGAVDIFDNGNKIATVTATGTNWTYTPSSSLQSGSHSITATDVAASKSSGVLSLSIDTAAAAPVITTLSAAQANTKSAPVITGTAEAGATVTLTATPVGDGDVQTFTAVANASGSWSLNTGVTSGANTALVANKAYTVRASQTDTAGNTSAASAAQTFNYDTVAVAPSINAVPASTASTLTLSGSGEAGATVRVFDTFNGGTASLGTAVVNNQGQWSFVANGLADGAHSFKAEQTDLAGNLSAQTTALSSAGEGATTVTVNSSALSAAVLAVTSDSGTLGDGITRVTTPGLSGQAAANAGVKVYDTFNGVETLVGTATANASGAWSISALTSTLGEGNHSLVVKELALDGITVTRTSDSTALTIDTTASSAPTISLISASDSGVKGDGITNVVTPTLTGKADANAWVNIYKGGSTLLATTQANGSGEWSHTLAAAQADGALSFTAKQTDAAGNESAASTALSVTVDSTAVALTLASNKSTFGTARYVMVYRGSRMDLGDVQVFSDGVNVALGKAAEGAVSVGAQGVHYRFSITNLTNGDTGAAGYVSSNHKYLNNWVQIDLGQDYSIDNIVVYPRNANVKMSTDLTVLTSQSSMGVGGSDINLAELKTDEDVAWSAFPSTTAVGVGMDSANIPIINGYTAPVAAAPTLKGTGEAGATVDIFDSAAVVAETNASGKIGSTVVNADGTWSFQATGIVSGSHTITTQQTDLAGNKSAPSNAYTFMVDSGVMGTPVLDAASDSGTVGDGITRVSTPTLKGTTLTSDGAVDIFDNGNKIATVTATGTNWTYTPSSSLQSGSHSITATDVAASKSSGVLSLSIDTAAAAPVITTLSAAQANTKSAPVITGTAEAGATVTLTATPVGDGDVQTFTAVANASGSWSLNTGVTSGANTALVANKAYTVRASQTDTAGNTSAASAAQTFNYDTVAVAPIVNIASATVAQVFALSGTAEAGAQVRVFDGTALVGTTTASNTGTWTLSVKALDSTTALHAMSATQTDLAGNQSAATNFTRTVDLGQLSQALLATASDTGTVGDGITSVGAPQLIGTNVSALGTVQVFDTFGGTTLLLGSAVADANGAWALGLTKPLSDGNHVLQVKEVSSSGSVLRTSDNNTVRIDTATPVALSKPILDPLSDFGTSNSDGVTNITQGLIYSGTGAEAYATIKVFAGSNAVAVGTTQADSTGAWRVSTSGGLDANASTYVYATQTDLAGNTSMASAASQLTTDSTIGTPTISATTTQGNNPVLSGTAEALSTVRVTVGLTTATTQADGQGVWMVQLSLAPSELTTYTASVQATDVAGNVSLSGRGLFSVDPSRSAVSLPAALAAPSLAAGQDTGLSNTDGISTIAKPTLNGTDAQSGATVQLWANGVHVASTTASDVGAYSFAANDYTSVLNGTSQLTVVQVVGTGADSTSSPHSLGITWTVDSLVAFSNPALTSSVTDSYGTLYSTSVASGLKPTLAGKAEAGASVKLFDNGAELATVTANALGEWTFAFSTLSAGKHSITTQVTDVAGNVSVLSSAYAFTTLSAALSEPVAQLKAGGDSGASATDGVTNVAAQVFTGTVSVSAGQDAPSVNVYDNGNLLATVQADSSGQWLYAATFTQGGHLITARAKDLSGNLSAATTVAQLSIDTTAPNTPAQPMLASGQDNGSSSTDGITRFSQPVFTGTAQAGATVELFDNGALLGTAVAHATTGVYSISPSARLTQGAHSITVQAVDLAGNRSAASAANVITVDGVINPISFLSLASANVLYSSGGEVVTTSARPTVQGFGEAGATVTVFNNGTTVLGTTRVGPDGRWSLALDADLAANNSLSAQQTDTAGNTSAPTAAMNVAYDSAATLPSLALQGSSDTGTLGDGITSRSTPTVTGSGAVQGDTVTLYNGTTVLGTGVADSTGKWTITVNTPLANNTAQNPTYTLTAKNTTQSDATLGSLKLKIDTQQDAAPTGLSLAADSDSGTLGDNTTNLTGPVVTGTGATAGATVRLLEGTTLLGQGVADSTGNWRVQSSTLTSGAHSLSAVQVDAAGNVSVASSPLVLVVDNSAATLNAPVLRASDDTGLVGDNLTSLSSVTVSGQGAEANAWVTVYDGSVSLARVQAGADGQWSAVLSNLAGNAAGKAYSLTARQTDTAGNISQAGAALALMVENSAARPSFGLQNSASNDTGVLGDGRTQNNHPVLTGQAEAGASVQVLRDDGNGVTTLLATVLADASGNFTWQPTDELALGSYRYLTQATDVAGNVSTLSAPFTLTIVPVTAISLRDVTGALSPQGGQLIDFNNDGLVDVVSQNAYLQTSTGIFVKGASTYVATGLGNESTFADTGSTGSVVDINGDGLNDIVTGSNRLFFTGSSGALIDANVYGATRWNKGHITVTDLLGDGQLSSVINGGVRIWVANGKQVGVSGDSTGDKMAAVYDANADGYLDVAFANGSLGVHLSRGDGSGIYQSTLANPGFGGNYSHITNLDLNNDGVLDVFSGAKIFQGLGNARYVEVTSDVGYVFGGNGDSSHVVIADINADGMQDILETNNFGSDVSIWINIDGVLQKVGNDTLFDRASNLTVHQFESTQLSAKDVNGDRSIDMAVIGPNSDISLTYNQTVVAENTYLRVKVAKSTGNETLSTGAMVTLYDSDTGAFVASRLVGNNVLGAYAARQGESYAEFFGLDPAKTYDVVVRYPGNDQGVTVVSGKSGLGTAGIANSALNEIVDSQLTAVTPGGKDVITVAPENRATATDGGNWKGTRYADLMVGDAGDDTFTPNGANAGEAGDTIDLSNGGHDKVVFNTVLNLNAATTISSFTLGSFTQADGNGDTINVSGLLTALGYTGARDVASLAWISGDPVKGMLKVDPGTDAADLMLRIYNGSGWQDLALITGADLTGKSVSDLIASGNLQLGQLSLGGTTPGITLDETGSGIRSALYSDVTVVADGGAFSKGFAQGSLKVTLGDAYAEDKLSLLSAGFVTVSGSDVHYKNVLIGTIDSTQNGAAGESLLVNFSFADTSLNNADQALAVQAVARVVQYQNTGNTPPDFYRDLTLQVSDGETSAKIVGQLTVTPVADTTLVAGESVVSGTNGVNVLTGTTGDDSVVGYGGPVALAGTASATGDTLTGNGGQDTFVYRKGNVGKDTITDFTLGTTGNADADKLNFADLLQGYDPANIADFVRLEADATTGQVSVKVDYNGKADGSVFTHYLQVDLNGVTLTDSDTAYETTQTDLDALRAAMMSNGQLILA